MSKMYLKEGYEFTTTNGKKCRVVGRVKSDKGSSSDMITCEFLEPPYDKNGDRVRVTRLASQVLKGIVVNPYEPTAINIGYTGEEIYDKHDSKVRQLRDKWYAIIDRVGKLDGYKNVTICDEWKDFSKFYQWSVNQIGWDCYSLDKDLLQQGVNNKVYSPETCVYVPQSINVCINQKEENNSTPTGVAYVRNETRVEVTIPIMNEDGKTINFRLGRFARDEKGIAEAFIHSKIAREQKLKTLATILRSNSLITHDAYCAITNYRWKSNHANMGIVNSILRPDHYQEDVRWFINTHHDFELKLNEMTNILNTIPLNKLSKLAE